MDAKEGFLFYCKGKHDRRLKTTIEYIFRVEDVQYSEITKTIQFMFSLEHPHTGKVLYFFEEFRPLSKRFKDFIDRLCYLGESSLTTKVCLEDLSRIVFVGKLQYVDDKLQLDIESASAEVSMMSAMFDQYNEIGLIIN